MGKLYDAAQQVQEIIERKGMDPFKTRGQISMRTGFLLTFVTPNDPDDEQKLASLRAAAEEVLGERLRV